jgi:hypothetical protein
MSNLLKYVENFFNESKTPPHSNNPNNLLFPSSSLTTTNNTTNNTTNKTNTNNYKTTLTNQGYINTNINPQSNSSAVDLLRRRKEIKENLTEESQIKIFGDNHNFNLDLKVFGRSIFQNLILTATATSKSNYTTNGTLSDNNPMIIPIKCTWKRLKNETEISISNINTNSYIPTAEDIGYTILVEAVAVDRNLYGDLPLFAQFGPIEMDLNVKNTLELLLTSGGTKFSCFLYDSAEQAKKTDKELILVVNSNELRLCEVDYNGKEKDLERCKLHHFNPQILLNAKDTQRFLLRFFKFEAENKNNFNKKLSAENKNNNQNNINNLNSKNNFKSDSNNSIQKQNGGFSEEDLENFELEAKFTQEVRKEYDLIAMSKQCREIIYLLIQIFLIDEKIKNSKLFACANYNLLPQETKIGVTDLITEIKTLREENMVLIINMQYYENLNTNLRKEMKELEEEFQISLESINDSMRVNSISNNQNNNSNNSNFKKRNNNNNNYKNSSNENFIFNSNNNFSNSENFVCSKCSNFNSNSKNSIAMSISNNNNNKSTNNNSNYNPSQIIPKANSSNNYNNKINLRSSSTNVLNINNNTENYLDLKLKYDELKELNLNLISKEKALREENQDLVLRLEISKNSIEDLTNENKKLKENLNQSNSDLNSLNKNSQILVEQKNKLLLERENVEKEKQMLSKKNSELILKLEYLEKTLNMQEKNQSEINEKKIEDLNKKNENLNYEIKNLIIQRNLQISQKDNLTKEFEKIKNEKAKNDKAQKDLLQEIENLSEIIKEKEKVFITFNNEVEKYKNENKECKEKYEILEIEYDSLKKNLDKNFLNFNFKEKYNYEISNNKQANLLLESYDENNNSVYLNYNNNNINNKNSNDSIRYGNYNEINNNLHKITSEEFEEFEILRREKEESDALIMQLKSNSEAKDMEIASLKKLIDGLRGKK